MSIPTGVLSFFRTEWADRFTDTCVVKRVATNVLNPSTGVYAPTYTTQYSGACLVRPVTFPQDSADVGQRQAELQYYTVFLPQSETDPLPDDLVDVTSATDIFLTGKQFVVRSIEGDTYVTVRRLWCEEVVNG